MVKDDLILPKTMRIAPTGIHNPIMIDLSGEVPKSRVKTTDQIMATARAAFQSGRTKDLAFRKAQLKALKRFLEERQEDILEALDRDLKKPKQEVFMGELDLLQNDLEHTLIELDNWAKPQKPDKRLINFLDKVMIFKDPYGVVLIIGAWNYPFLLLLGPLIGAIAGGNTVILKPSEVTPTTSALLARQLPSYLDPSCYQLVEGGAPETTELLRHRFDYIFFTGSTAIGRIIHAAAAKHLTPTTLELGGKSPVYIDSSVDMATAVRRILWGKCLNSGQTCISPDYVLCSKEVEGEFLRHARKVLREFYGEDVKVTPHLSKIVTDRHFSRLLTLLADGTVALGGNYDVTGRMLAPTILTDVKLDSPLMEEEIFGPILPIVTVNSPQEAVDFINSKEKPLALYVFSESKSVQKFFLHHTSSGAVSINDTIMHISTENLPFGGVGSSGMGAYHGKAGFDTFTHQKSVLVKSLGFLAEASVKGRYPPYSELKTKVLSQAIKKRRGVGFKGLGVCLVFGIGFVLGYGVDYLYKKWQEDDF